MINASQKSSDDYYNYSGQLLGFTIVIASIVSFLAVFSIPFVSNIGRGFSAEMRAIVIFILYLLVPYLFLSFFKKFFSGVLRAKRLFTVQALSELVDSASMVLIIFVGLLKFSPLYVLPISLVGSCAFSLLFQILFLKNSLKPIFVFDKSFDKFVKLFFLFSIFYLTNILYAFVDKVFASYLPEKAISALVYGLLIALLPFNIVKLEQLFFTSLSERFSKQKILKFSLAALAISIPFSVFLFVFSKQIISFLIGYGAFGGVDVYYTSQALSFYVLALPGYYFVSFLSRILMIKEDFLMLFYIGIISILVNVGFNYLFLFKLEWGIKGLALSTSIVIYATCLAEFFVILKKYVKGYKYFIKI